MNCMDFTYIFQRNKDNKENLFLEYEPSYFPPPKASRESIYRKIYLYIIYIYIFFYEGTSKRNLESGEEEEK